MTSLQDSAAIGSFSDIGEKSPSTHVRGCVVADRVRVLINPEEPEASLFVNVTFPESIFEQSYFFRISAVMSDSSVILQDMTYNNWGAFSRGCLYTKEYLQT